MTAIRIWNLWACDHNGTPWHVGARRWVELHYSSDPVIPVLVEELDGSPIDPEATHYGWRDTGKSESPPCMIFPRVTASHLKPHMLLDMCFAYGMDVEVKAGKGNMVALRITRREEGGVL